MNQVSNLAWFAKVLRILLFRPDGQYADPVEKLWNERKVRAGEFTAVVRFRFFTLLFLFCFALVALALALLQARLCQSRAKSF